MEGGRKMKTLKTSNRKGGVKRKPTLYALGQVIVKVGFRRFNDNYTRQTSNIAN